MAEAMNKPLLMIPGPVDSPDEVLRRCGLPVFPHYEGDFPTFFDRLVTKMAGIFGLRDGLVFIPIGSGTTAVDMMLASICTPDDSVLLIHNGSFGDYAERNLSDLGIPYTNVYAPWGSIVDPDRVRAEMKKNRHTFIYLTHNESSTAVLNPIPPIGEIAREFDALLLVDSVSGVGGVVIDMDDAGADVVAGASQKCLELPPGLAPVAVGRRAWERMERMKHRRVPYVLDFMRWRKAFREMHDIHPQLQTGSTTLLYALDWVADRIGEEGLENRQERFRATGERLKSGLAELGFFPSADSACASPVVTDFLMPDRMPSRTIRTFYMERFNTMVGNGVITDSSGEIISFRVAHFGRSAEIERIDHMIEITRIFVNE